MKISCCGQSARIGRYSFKNALFLFLDVWGMGNRGMFRTLRDLILRPGYLIRDYISGMQMAYFPPFKLLFLLTALLLVVDSGVNLKGDNYLASYHEQTKESLLSTNGDSFLYFCNQKEKSSTVQVEYVVLIVIILAALNTSM